jgi:hypothetical protein
MTAPPRVTPPRSRHRTGLAALFALARLVVGTAALGCAGGGDDPGVAPDRCKARDCGPTSGGLDADELDSDEEFDTAFPPPGDTAIADTLRPTDTAVDTAVAETKADTAKVDTAVPDTADSAPLDTAPPCTIPTGKTCGWSPQCGCGVGQNCDFTSTDGSVACVAAGTVDRNGKCTTLGQCKKGLTCVAGLCMPFCTVVADCPAGSTQLCHTVSGGTTDVPGLLVCMQQCDPRAPAAVCGASTACEIIDSAKGDTTCTRAGTSTALGGCATDAFACAAGYTCTSGDCLAWCRVGYPGDCTGGRTCFQFSDHPKIKGVEYGVCDF